MIVDTSAILAILMDEDERPRFTAAISDAAEAAISAGTLLETAIVVEARYGAEGGQLLDLLLERASMEIVPVDAQQVRLAQEGYRRFGKGRHPAGLNFGDCFAYALARHRRQRLLFKGDDFPRTDIVAAIG